MSSYLELARKVIEGGPSTTTKATLAERRNRRVEESGCSECVSRWSKYPTWIELHDPTTGEWHELRASECLPGVVAQADKHREQGGAA